MSCDELKIIYWNIENTQNAFAVVDMTPEDVEDISEVITSFECHPTIDTQFVFGMNTGYFKLCDLRVSSTCNDSGIWFIDEKSKPNIASELLELAGSICDVTFTKDGKHIISRDFLRVKLWDIKMPSQPLEIIALNDSMKTKLFDLYEKEAIFERFSVKASPCGTTCVSGFFGNQFHICDFKNKTNQQYVANFDRKTIVKNFNYKEPKILDGLPDDFNSDKRIIKTAWHPKSNMLAVAYQNSLFTYCRPM